MTIEFENKWTLDQGLYSLSEGISLPCDHIHSSKDISWATSSEIQQETRSLTAIFKKDQPTDLDTRKKLYALRGRISKLSQFCTPVSLMQLICAIFTFNCALIYAWRFQSSLNDLTHQITAFSIRKKKRILKRAIKLIQKDANEEVEKVNRATKEFFQRKLKELQAGKNVALPGGFYHCTKEEALPKIFSKKILEPGGANIYGVGIYAAYPPETHYGSYRFSIDGEVDHLPNDQHEDRIKDIHLIRPRNNETVCSGIWAAFRGTIPVSRETVLLVVPEEHKLPSNRPDMEIITCKVDETARALIHQAEEELSLVELPIKSLWHFASGVEGPPTTIPGHAKVPIPKHYQTAASWVKACPKILMDSQAY